jgi:hypothetical protein
LSIYVFLNASTFVIRVFRVLSASSIYVFLDASTFVIRLFRVLYDPSIYVLTAESFVVIRLLRVVFSWSTYIFVVSSESCVGVFVEVGSDPSKVDAPDTLKEVVESPWKFPEDDDNMGWASVVFPDTLNVPPTAKLITARFDDITYII